jgi:hypothetical protein
MEKKNIKILIRFPRLGLKVKKALYCVSFVRGEDHHQQDGDTVQLHLQAEGPAGPRCRREEGQGRAGSHSCVLQYPGYTTNTS